MLSLKLFIVLMRSVSTIISVHFDSNVVEKAVNLKQTAYSDAYMYILYILPMFIRQLYIPGPCNPKATWTSHDSSPGGG